MGGVACAQSRERQREGGASSDLFGEKTRRGSLCKPERSPRTFTEAKGLWLAHSSCKRRLHRVQGRIWLLAFVSARVWAVWQHLEVCALRHSREIR